jgi:hypothetical protein
MSEASAYVAFHREVIAPKDHNRQHMSCNGFVDLDS